LPALVTLVARIQNWQALRQFYAQRLAIRVYEAGAIRLHVYRNSQDAAEVLLVAEAPNPAVAQALGRLLAEHLTRLAPEGRPDERVWESMRWEEAPAKG
jgi:hypothetical protein